MNSPIRIKVHIAEWLALAERARIAVHDDHVVGVATRQARQRLALVEARIRRIQAGDARQPVAGELIVFATRRADDMRTETVPDQMDVGNGVRVIGEIFESVGQMLADLFGIEGGPLVQGVHVLGGIDGLGGRKWGWLKVYWFWYCFMARVESLHLHISVMNIDAKLT